MPKLSPRHCADSQQIYQSMVCSTGLMRDDPPTLTVRVPLGVTHFASLVDQYCIWRSPTCMVTVLAWPAPRCTRSKATSARTGNCTPSGTSLGAPRYTCGTSSDSTDPVFFTFTLTSNPPPAFATFRSE